MDEHALIRQLKHRCAVAGLSVEEQTEDFEAEDGEVRTQRLGWSVSSATKEFVGAAHLHLPFDIQFALTTSFDQFRPIKDYEAMWSPREGLIESVIVLRPLVLQGDHVFTDILKQLGISEHGIEPKQVRISFPAEPGDPIVTLRFSSRELLIWRTAAPTGESIHSDALIPCIRIEGLRPRSEDEAKEQLEAFANGALLELERRTGVAARLQNHYPWRLVIGPSRPKTTLRRIESTPEVVPMSLYMNARLETSNLAARFLGFYQVLEYFFPRYSVAVEIKRLRDALVDESHSFAAIADSDLRLILERTQLNRGGRGVGGELDQFKQTLAAVVGSAELRVFINEVERLRAFYSKANAPIVKERIKIENEKQDLRKDAAERLYKIRCRIVHAKEELEGDVFIPFAAEVAELEPDVELIRFLAQRALWACVRPIRKG